MFVPWVRWRGAESRRPAATKFQEKLSREPRELEEAARQARPQPQGRRDHATMGVGGVIDLDNEKLLRALHATKRDNTDGWLEWEKKHALAIGLSLDSRSTRRSRWPTRAQWPRSRTCPPRPRNAVWCPARRREHSAHRMQVRQLQPYPFSCGHSCEQAASCDSRQGCVRR